MYQSILVHYGELALKGGNRAVFEDLLVKNISATLEDTGAKEVRRLPGRIYIDYPERHVPEIALHLIQRVFGVENAAPALCVPSEIGEITQAVHHLIEGRSFTSFAIRTRRAEKQFPLSSMEVSRLIGSAVAKASGARVDLDHPDFSVCIEILNRKTFIFSDSFAGPGGLPVGSAGKVACLLSGGIDSPVAAWRMMKRGCFPVYIHFHSAPFTSTASIEKVLDIVELFSVGLHDVRLVIVPFGAIQQRLVTSAPEEYRVILYRRLMVRIAELIAREVGAEALVTGDALSQVASQTLSNLITIEAATAMPILRPLVGMDKQEIVDEAKKIGTFETSCLPHDDCCSFLMPSRPVTHSTSQELDRVERSLDIDALVQMGFNQKEIRLVSGGSESLCKQTLSPVRRVISGC